MKKFSQITPDEDSPLLLSWYRGDFSAFETLIWKYQKRAFNLALLLTGAEKSACAAVENSFIAAYQNIRTLKSTVRFSSWLIALTLKECREFDNYQHEGLEESADVELPLDDETSYAAALHKKLALCIRSLPPELGEVILLRYVRGFTLERVEEILQISGEMLLNRLFEAQETLACWLRSDTDDPAELAAMKAAVSSLHPDIRRNFSAYLDSSVESDEKELTKTHLKSCGSCREALAELEWMVEDIKSIPDVEPPNWLAPSIIAKVKSSPAKPAAVTAPRSSKIQIAATAIFVAVIAIYSYLVQSKPESEPMQQPAENLPAATPPAAQKTAPAKTGPTAIPPGVFTGAPVPEDKQPRAEDAARRPAFPLPGTLPAGRDGQIAPAARPVSPVTPVTSGQNQHIEKPKAMQPGLEEWGDSLPQARALPKKATQAAARSGEIAVLLSTSDAVTAAHDIESAVAAIGGRINGRAYSGGNDILYVNVEVDRFFELMGRLGKIGRIQELPRLPEGAEGALDLVIRW